MTPGPAPAATLAAATAEDPAPVPILLRTEDKQELNATYYAPKKAKELVPGVLLVHNQGAKAEELAPIATYLASRGLGVLLLELRGHGTNAKKTTTGKPPTRTNARPCGLSPPRTSTPPPSTCPSARSCMLPSSCSWATARAAR
ncbi:MAG: hypothetical protein R3E96_06320 [Planctomycetota bacterium]